MRIKRFTAPDMRTALRMVRDEQGPDAVILSNRPCAEGVEVVSATDYDEALVHQALRAATPPIAPAEAPATVAAVAPTPVAAATAAATNATSTSTAASAGKPVPSVRETLATRARAVFRIGDAPRAGDGDGDGEPTLAELTATTPESAPGTIPAPPQVPTEQTRFDAMMAALGAPATREQADDPARDDAGSPAAAATDDTAQEIAPTVEPAPQPATNDTNAADEARHLHVVPRWDADPAVAAMREELSSMRQLIEREMGQFSVERLKGSPARAAAFDTLIGYGCDETLAQQIAGRLDPALDPNRFHAPMLAELARMLTIAREEPIEDGGVIALVGPTGAGKTTTAAKIAARFAARHRARDVALVTTDAERVGACEQLHAHGRRLGVTVCEAHGPQALQQTLAQLQDYPLVVVDTAGYGARDRALLGQITWLRATERLRSLLVLPANAHPHDLNEVVRRYRMAGPEGVVLTKLDETGRLGAALSVVIRNGLSLAYTTAGQQVATDLSRADASHLVLLLEKLRRAADNPLATEDRHAVA